MVMIVDDSRGLKIEGDGGDSDFCLVSWTIVYSVFGEDVSYWVHT